MKKKHMPWCAVFISSIIFIIQIIISKTWEDTVTIFQKNSYLDYTINNVPDCITAISAIIAVIVGYKTIQQMKTDSEINAVNSHFFYLMNNLRNSIQAMNLIENDIIIKGRDLFEFGLPTIECNIDNIRGFHCVLTDLSLIYNYLHGNNFCNNKEFYMQYIARSLTKNEIEILYWYTKRKNNFQHQDQADIHNLTFLSNIMEYNTPSNNIGDAKRRASTFKQ